jgi:hypothetical protein
VIGVYGGGDSRDRQHQDEEGVVGGAVVDRPRRHRQAGAKQTRRDQRRHDPDEDLVGHGSSGDDPSTADDHDCQRETEQEKQPCGVAGVGRGGHLRDPHPAQDARRDCQAEYHDQPAEGRSQQDQDADAAHGVEGDPFRDEGQAEDHAEDRHAEPEGDPALPHVEPQEGEDQVRQ